MKFLVFVFCSTVFVISVARAANAEVEDDTFREEYCKSVKYSINKEHCSTFRCTKDNSKIIAVGCAEARCSGKPVGFKGDRSKPYPECCMIPVCDSSE